MGLNKNIEETVTCNLTYSKSQPGKQEKMIIDTYQTKWSLFD